MWGSSIWGNCNNSVPTLKDVDWEHKQMCTGSVSLLWKDDTGCSMQWAPPSHNCCDFWSNIFVYTTVSVTLYCSVLLRIRFKDCISHKTCQEKIYSLPTISLLLLLWLFGFLSKYLIFFPCSAYTPFPVHHIESLRRYKVSSLKPSPEEHSRWHWYNFMVSTHEIFCSSVNTSL